MARIEADALTLELPLFLQRERTTKSLVMMLAGAAFDPPRRTFTRVLDGVSFTAEEGDRIAIVGRNGAGKSTLLRILTGAYRPTSGHLHVEGSRHALLNISLGFNNEATVKENVFLRGIAMDMPVDQLRANMEAILEFAGLTDKARHRLKTLSSGQRMRLGFSIATAMQRDIMVMDEWIGAGDASFIQKARVRIRSRVDAAKILVLASHNFSLLKAVCNKGLFLDGGRVAYSGDIQSTLEAYEAALKAVPIVEGDGGA